MQWRSAFRNRVDRCEWLGAEYELPQPIVDGKRLIRPSVVIWLELPRNVLVGLTMIDPNKPLSFAETLEEAMRRPAEGKPRRPARIRVPEARMAAALRDVAGNIPVVVAPVPELDAIFSDLMNEFFEGAPETGDPESDIAPALGELDLFDADDSFEPQLPRVTPVVTGTTAGRNDPCPCGSGKKYKKCHLLTDAPVREAPTETVHEMDFRLVEAISRFAFSRFGPEWSGAVDEDAEDESGLQLFVPWASWTAAAGGKRIADSFYERNQRHLPDREREWFEAQRNAWLSVFEDWHFPLRHCSRHSIPRCLPW